MSKDYFRAHNIFAISLLSISLVYLSNYSSPKGYLALFTLPVIYGYAAHISEQRFNWATLAALPLLLFAIMGGITAVYSIFAGLGPVLISAFTGSKDFGGYYRSTKVPLAILGAVVGVTLVFTIANDPALKEEVKNGTSEYLGQRGSVLIKQSNMLSSQKDKQAEMVEKTSINTIKYTEAIVINETRENLTNDEINSVSSGFSVAQQRIPYELSSKIRTDNSSANISALISDTVSSRFEERHLLLIIPFLISIMIALQPVIGVLTYISAKIFDRLETSFSLSPS